MKKRRGVILLLIVISLLVGCSSSGHKCAVCENKMIGDIYRYEAIAETYVMCYDCARNFQMQFMCQMCLAIKNGFRHEADLSGGVAEICDSCFRKYNKIGIEQWTREVWNPK